MPLDPYLAGSQKAGKESMGWASTQLMERFLLRKTLSCLLAFFRFNDARDGNQSRGKAFN